MSTGATIAEGADGPGGEPSQVRTDSLSGTPKKPYKSVSDELRSLSAALKSMFDEETSMRCQRA
jgi:hypothetical protein